MFFSGARGVTFEQAARDIKLSGDIRQIGEAAARVAIGDGLAQYNGKKKYSKNIEEDIYYPRTNRERSAFNRSMANKTSGLKDGETKRIIIYTGDNVYLVTADGYLSGNIEECVSLQQNQDIVNERTQEWLKNDTSDEGFNILLEAYGDESGGYSSSVADVGYRNEADTAPSMDSQKSKSRRTRNTQSSELNYQRGKVTVAEGVKLSAGEKAILSRVAKSGNVAIVVEGAGGAAGDSKGVYSDKVIRLNADKLSEGGFTYTGIHESVHYVSDVNHEGYKAIERFVENYYKEKGVDLESELAKTQAYYKSKGVELTEPEAMEEIVCNTLSDIATDEDALSAFLGLDNKSQNKFIEAIKSIVRKLKEWANKCLKGTEYHSIVMNDADTLLSLAKQLRAELTKAGQKNNTAQSGEGKKHLFASSTAKTTDKSHYQQAVKMHESGASKNEIWQETGWFRGYDGKWRFEIDDSKAVFRVGGDAMQLSKPEYQRWADLLLTEERTEAEEQEFNKLSETFGEDFWNDKNSLQDYLIHDELFEAYPQLKDMNVFCFPMPLNLGGRYDTTTDTVYLNSLLEEQELTEILFHELQHKIQSIEGLAEGASTEYWQDELDKGYKSVKSARELYDNTAGEIEARDVTARLKLIAEQRKNTLPDINRKDVVFADDSLESFYLVGKTAEGYEVYKTSDEMKSMSYTDKIDVFKQNFYKEGTPQYIGSHIKFQHDGKTYIAEINRHTQNENTEKLNPKRLNQWDKAKINIGAEGDFITLLENTVYDSSKPNTTPYKNDIHKITDYFEYYVKTVWIDDKLYDVVVSISVTKNDSRLVYDVQLKRKKDSQHGPQIVQSYENNFENRRPKVEKSTRLSESFDNNVSQEKKVVNKKSYSFGEEDMDMGLYLSEGNSSAENLRNSNQAFGEVLTLFSDIEADADAVGRIMNKHLKRFIKNPQPFYRLGIGLSQGFKKICKQF